jgi:hypothetical protein
MMGPSLTIGSKFNAAVDELLEQAERYRMGFYGRQLSYEEVQTSRQIMAHIRESVQGLYETWPRNAVDEQAVSDLLTSPKFNASCIETTVSSLANVMTLANLNLSKLEAPVAYLSHYEQQCRQLHNMNSGVAPEILQSAAVVHEDALAMQSMLNRLVTFLRSEVRLKESQIRLLNLRSQTALSARLSKLTLYVVYLTILLTILTVVAVISGLLAVVSGSG